MVVQNGNSREAVKNGNSVENARPNRVIAIASSAGGLQALKTIVADLPQDFPGAILIVQHLSALFKSHLTSILNRYSTLQVNEAREGMRLVAGNIYVTPPDKHLIVNSNGVLSLSDAPKEHFVRPSAEYTFKSLANSYGKKALAVVLTGGDGDGQEGVRVIKKMGGKVIAQNRETSEVFGMPYSAIETGCVDFIMPIDRIADGIVDLVYS